MYRSNESYTLEGYWAFSKDPTYWFSGVLEFSPENHKTELRMWGEGEGFDIDFYTDTILGRTTDNKKITLLNCIIRNGPRSTLENNKSEKITHFIIKASRVLIGQHYKNINEINYSSLTLEYSDQCEFIQKDGFQHDYSSEKLLVSYKEPDDIVIISDESIEIKIHFIGQPDILPYPSNISSIVQLEHFLITFPKKHDLTYLRNEINFLKYFITFSINRNVFPLECCFREENINNEGQYTFVDLLDSSFRDNKSKYGIHHSHHNIIEIDDFSQYPDLYVKWRTLCNKKESAIYKFFPTIYDDNSFLDERFHKLIMAFEDYHRNSPKFLQQIPYTNKNGKKDKRDPSLTERIENVFEKFEQPLFYLFKDINDQDRIIRLIKDTRHYLTHGGDVRKKTSVKDPDSYFALSDLLIVLISLMILDDLGFSKDVIKDKIWHLPSYYDLVENDWSIVQ